MDPYIHWLKKKQYAVFESSDCDWRLYQNALVPASLKPEPIELSIEQARDLLSKSGAYFVRYLSRTSERPTAFWYTACDTYEFKSLPRKVRSQIRRALKDCRIEKLDPEWLADNGYECFRAAFTRYQNVQPGSRTEFDEMCRGSVGGPFEFWGAFVGDMLAGFAKCVVGDDYVACVVFKLHPQFLPLSPASALQDAILNTYVANQQKTVFNGFRSLVHNSNMDDFLLKFGYRRIFCDLKLVYRPSVQAFITLSFPFRKYLDRLPESIWRRRIGSLFAQEEIRRSFELDGKRTGSSNEPYFYRIVRSIWGNRYGTTVK